MLRARSEGRGRKPRDQDTGAPNAAAGSGLSPEATTGLMEAILGRANMMAALRRVVANKGTPGVDGVPVERLGDHLKAHCPRIKGELLTGRYRPAAVRGVKIPKPGGGTRGLGIPTVLDRLIQQAMHQVPMPFFHPGFSEAPYGFRPGRSAHDAVLAARAHVAGGRRFVVDLDLEKFFDRVNHDVLMARVARRVGDKRVGAGDPPRPAGWIDGGRGGGVAERGDAAARPLVERRGQPHERRLPESLVRPVRPALLHGPPPPPQPRCLNRRIRNRTYGGVRGRGLALRAAPSYSI